MLSLSGQVPAEGSKNNDLDSMIEFTIVSSVSRLDVKNIPSSLSIFQAAGLTTVSYTHLTLPTICSV